MSANFADKTFLTTSLQDMSLDGNEQSASRSMPAHFTSPFRLLDVPDVGPHQPLSRIITLASSGSYKDGSSAYGTINATHEKIRKNLAPRPPPTSLMRTSKVLNALASKTWLSSGVFHLYLASWSTLDEGLLKQISGMTAVVVTLDIRAGQPHLINSGQEGRLRASEFAAKVRALVRALQVKCEKLMVRVVQGRMAGLNVAAVIVNVFRMPVQLRVKFAHIIVLLNNEENVMTPGGSIVPLLLGSKFLRKMVGDMVGIPFDDTAKSMVTRREKDRTVVRRWTWAMADSSEVGSQASHRVALGATDEDASSGADSEVPDALAERLLHEAVVELEGR